VSCVRFAAWDCGAVMPRCYYWRWDGPSLENRPYPWGALRTFWLTGSTCRVHVNCLVLLRTLCCGVCIRQGQSRACERSVSGAWAEKKPLRAPTYFCTPRSPLRSRSAPVPSFSRHARSTLRSAPPDFRPAKLRFPLRLHALGQRGMFLEILSGP